MSFDEIYQQYWQKIFRLCLGYVSDFSLAQDMAQETFIIVWEQLPKFRKESSIGTWTYRIASNHCLRQIEKGKRMPKSKLPFNLQEETTQTPDPKIQLLYRYISELPETDRILISLELEGVKQKEIAEILGVSHGNVRIKTLRIKKKLMLKFKENEH